MAFTEVLLIKPVDGLGAEGEQVRVRAGFARNFLLPQGIALPVNRSNTKYVEQSTMHEQHTSAQHNIRKN